ncbi:MAG: flippase-like domain-containing protein [Acidobacteria bacterium]|nr:flippase-like domain-containing protein [Acidobacteriota bacterium]MBI3264742.1 flippase-like domain-containing protein [Acidobacteriota bacterium]
MRASLKTAIVLLLAVGLLAVFLRHANLTQVWAEIVHGRGDLVAAAMVGVASTYLLRTIRWQYLLAPIGPTHFSVALRTTVIGFAASTVLPARVGEVLRPYLLARREDLSATATFATIILERLLDLITVVLMLTSFIVVFDPGMTAVDPRLYNAVKIGALGAAALSLVTLAAVLVLSGHPARLEALLDRLRGRVPDTLMAKVSSFGRAFLHGLAVIRRPTRLLNALLLSVPLWLSIATTIWLVPVAFGIPVPYSGSFLLTALLVIGVAVPTPGAVGGFHEAFRIGVTVFYGAPNDKAVGAAIILHAISFIPVTIVGLLFMMQEGLDVGRARRLAGQVRTEQHI